MPACLAPCKKNTSGSESEDTQHIGPEGQFESQAPPPSESGATSSAVPAPISAHILGARNIAVGPPVQPGDIEAVIVPSPDTAGWAAPPQKRFLVKADQNPGPAPRQNGQMVRGQRKVARRRLVPVRRRYGRHGGRLQRHASHGSDTDSSQGAKESVEPTTERIEIWEATLGDRTISG
ncbi:hypothetical protein MMC06_003819 [Schaereria dolodes]|nr:hypothetical protein [Schaereria dolodes]